MTQCCSGSIHVLVPGAGLGRLAFDIAKAGYSSQGNEFSYFMLLASNMVLNRYVTRGCSMPICDGCRSDEPNQFEIFPYVHNSCNVNRTADMVSFDQV